MDIVEIENTSKVFNHYKTNGDAKVYEKVVENIILKRYCTDDNLKDYIINGDIKNKRLMLLSLLNKKNFKWDSIRKHILKNRLTNYEHFYTLIKLFKDYIINDFEKIDVDNFFTPIDGVGQDLIDLVEKYDESFWKNPKNKVLDPSSGIGTFLILALIKFMKGLEEYIPNTDERYKYIVENCLYYTDNDIEKTFIWLTIIDPFNQYETNTYCGSFINKGFEEHKNEVWNVSKFNLIIQSPPYNKKQKRGKGSTIIWDKFVLKSQKLLSSNGKMCFVHTPIWRKPQSEHTYSKDVHELLFSKQILELRIFSKYSGYKLFGTKSRFDYYILENKDIYTDTKIIDEDNNEYLINIKNKHFIPNSNIDKINDLMLITPNKSNIIFNRHSYGTDRGWVSSTKDEIFKYPLVHTTPKNGVRYMYSKHKDNGHYGVPKVIFGETSVSNVVIDMEGEYGMTQDSMAIPVNSLKEANKIKKALLSDDFKKFMKSVTWSKYRIDWRLFMYIRKDFYKHI